MQRDLTPTGLSAALGEHHRHCDAMLAAAQAAVDAGDWDAVQSRFGALCRALVEHFAFEEEDLFPEFERGTGLEGPTADLRRQHKAIREILEALGAASPRHDPEGFGSEFATLSAMLRQHVAEEEALMYPALERVLGARAGAGTQPNPDAGPAGALDVRGLPPPEPFLRVMEALGRTRDGPLRVLIAREPFPLYEVLQERGLAWHTRALESGEFEVLIQRSKS